MHHDLTIQTISGSVIGAKAFVDIVIGGVKLPNVEIFVTKYSDVTFLGQSALRDLTLLLDGPNGVVRLWPKLGVS